MSSSKQVTIYGIKNCDTMKKAMKWLDAQGIAYHFHDYKKEGLSENLAAKWLETLPLDKLVNQRGTTWRKLDDEQKQNLSVENAPALMAEQPSLVKRPVLDTGVGLHLGFKDQEYQTLFAS